jgi:hypothetical protein
MGQRAGFLRLIDISALRIVRVVDLVSQADLLGFGGTSRRYRALYSFHYLNEAALLVGHCGALIYRSTDSRHAGQSSSSSVGCERRQDRLRGFSAVEWDEWK